MAAATTAGKAWPGRQVTLSAPRVSFSGTKQGAAAMRHEAR